MNFKERTLFQLFRKWAKSKKKDVESNFGEFLDLREEVFLGEKPHDLKLYSWYSKQIYKFIKENNSMLSSLFITEDINLKEFADWCKINGENFRISKKKIDEILDKKIYDFLFHKMTGLWIKEAKKRGVL